MNTTKVSNCRPSSLLPRLFFLTLLLALGIGALHAAEAEADRKYEEGLQAFDNGDFRAAVIHLKISLQLDPTILSAHILLGQAYVEEGAGGAAESELQTAKRLGADRTLVLPPLARAYMQQFKYRQVVDEIYPGTGNAKIDAEILLLRGESHLALGELDLASSAFAEAAALRPKDPAPLLGKANVLLQRGETDAADAEAVAALELDPEDSLAWLVKGSIAHARGNIRDALANYEKAIALDPENAAAQLARLGTLIDVGRNAEAIEAAKTYRQAHPEDARAVYLLAVVLSRGGDSAGAQQALEEAYALISPIPEEVLQSHAPTLLFAGVLAFTLGNLEEAYARLERYAGTYPPASGARKLLGAILIKQRNYSGAIKVLEPVLEFEPANPRLLLMLGEAFMREGRHHPASELFERAVRLRPDSAEARVQRAVNRLAVGKGEAAVEELSAVFDERPEIGRVGALLVDLHLRQGDARVAADVAARLVEAEPDNFSRRNQLALALVGSGRVEEARQALDQILVSDPTYTPAELNLAKLELMLGRVPEADARYKHILKREPGESRATIGRARALVGQGQTEEAIGLLQKVQSGEGKIADDFRLDAAAILVELLIGTGQVDSALRMAEKAELVAPADPRVIMALGNVHRALGDKVTAQSLYRRLSKDAGYDSVRLLAIGRLQFLAEDLEGALWSVSKAVVEDPAYLDARVKQVELLSALGRSEKALEAAQVLASEHSERPDAQRVLGDVLSGADDRAGALAAYERALELAPSAAAVLAVYRARLALGQEAEARGLLVERVASNPGDKSVRAALAEDYLRKGRWGAAGELYETLVEGGAGNAGDYNNLAVIYARNGDPKAREYARRAHQLDPDSPAVNDTLGWLLVQAGEVEGGLGYLRKAEVRAAQDPEVGYHIGAALHRLGRSNEARAALERALGSDRPFAGRENAAALLQELAP